jgi:spoIIIJ-associated protein
MSDQTTLEIIAPTVEEALSQGLSQLGLTADAVSVEVLDSGSKGLFGLGGRQVRVRLTVNPPPGEYIPASKPSIQSQDKPAHVRRAESAPKAKEKEREAKPHIENKSVVETPVVEKKVEHGDHDPVLNTAEAVVSKLIHHLGMKAQVSAHYDDSVSDDRRTIMVDVRGDNLSALIGRQAETLNAFQYIASLIVGKETQQWVQLTVDVEGFRSRREKQVRQIALRMVEQVVKTGRKAALEPMTASERRVIHIELRGHPAVTTESTGEEPHRKVVILPRE